MNLLKMLVYVWLEMKNNQTCDTKKHKYANIIQLRSIQLDFTVKNKIYIYYLHR